MEDAGQTGLRTRANRYRGTRQSGSRRNAAEHRQHHVADALCEQLLIVIEFDAGRAAGRRTAQQAFEHVQHRDGECRCQQSRNRVPVNLCRRQTIRQHERFRNLADGCYIELQNHRCRSCDDNADERGRYDRVPLFREEHHQQNDKKRDQRGSNIRMKAEILIRDDLRNRTGPFRVRAEEVVDLPHCDDDRNTRGKTGDNRRGYEGGQVAEVQHGRKDEQRTGEKGCHEHALHAVGRDQRAENGCHCTGRTGNLIIAAGQRRDDKTGNNRRNQAAGRRRTGRYAERQCQRQRHCRNGQTGHQVLGQLLPVVALEFLLKLPQKCSSHDVFIPLFVILPYTAKSRAANGKRQHPALWCTGV